MKDENVEQDKEDKPEMMEVDETQKVDAQLVKVVLHDLDRLIDSYLIGTNRKSIRNSA